MCQFVKQLLCFIGNLATMTGRAMSADPAQPSATTAGASIAANASPPATAVAQDRLAEDMEATAMSIDTPSYARSLGMGQPGSSTGFAGGMFHPSQDLAQSMSIDGAQAMQFGAPLNPGGSVRHGERKEKIMLLSDHKGSLQRRQPAAFEEWCSCLTAHNRGVRKHSLISMQLVQDSTTLLLMFMHVVVHLFIHSFICLLICSFTKQRNVYTVCC